MLITSTQVQQATAQEMRDAESPVFSRDGKQIVYIAGVKKAGEFLPSRRELWVVNTDGSGARRLADVAFDAYPRFHPDGRQIVFVRDNDLWLVNNDGSGLRNFTNTPNDRESGADFLNDGQSLVFLRKSPDKMDPKLKAEIVRDTPLAALGFDNVQSVVLRNLATGAERVLLGDGYNVVQVTPVYFDNNVVFIICDILNNDGKPQGGLGLEKNIAVLRLNGSMPEMVARLKPGSEMTLKSMRARPHNNIVEVSLSDKIGSHIGVLQDGVVTLLDDAPVFGDVSYDGTTIVGTKLDNKLNSVIVLYDIATRTVRALGQPLAEAPLVEAAPPVTPPLAVTPSKAATPADVIPAAAKELVKNGEKLHDDERYTEAIAEFTKAIALHPQYAEAYYRRAESHNLNDDATAAMRDINEAIRIDPKQVLYYMSRADLYSARNETDKAIADLTTAMGITPGNYLLHNYRGETYILHGDMQLAIVDFTESIKLHPKNLSALMLRGKTQRALRNHLAALADFTTAIGHYPDFADAYRQRALVHRAMGKADLAAADEQKAAALEAKN